MQNERNPDRQRNEAGLSRAEQQRMAFVLSLRERGLADVALLRAMETVPREMFVPHHFADLAWRDMALPLDCGQMMLRPFTVARMVAALEVERHHRVLEVGAGSGYGTAILARLAGQVRSCERFRTLAHAARARLERLELGNAIVSWDDGFDLSAQDGAFDRVLVDAAIAEIPPALLAALAPDGLIVYARRPHAGAAQPCEAGVYTFRRTPSGSVEDFVFPGHFVAATPGRSLEL